MQTTQLGSTGLTVSRIGLGLAALGRPGYINLGHAADLKGSYQAEAMEAQAHAMLDLAWRKGVRYFDTARSYGKGEAFLGSWLKQRLSDPSTVTVGSKWGYTYTANWQTQADKHEVKEHTLPVLQRQWNETQSALGEFLDLYQIHSATLESKVLENADVLSELAKIKAAGVKIGLTLSGPAQAETLKRAMEATVDGRRLFDTVQATWNLLEPSAGPVLKEAHEAGMGVIVKEAVANGRLTDRNSDPEFAVKKRMLQRLANENNCGIDAVALAAVVTNSWAHVVLSGAAAEPHLESNLRALEISFSESERDNLIAQLQEKPEVYWTKRGALEWN